MVDHGEVPVRAGLIRNAVREVVHAEEDDRVPRNLLLHIGLLVPILLREVVQTYDRQMEVGAHLVAQIPIHLQVRTITPVQVRCLKTVQV